MFRIEPVYFSGKEWGCGIDISHPTDQDRYTGEITEHLDTLSIQSSMEGRLTLTEFLEFAEQVNAIAEKIKANLIISKKE